MATPTPNLGLIMPDMSDEVDQTIPQLATSMSKIDTAVSENSNGLAALKADVPHYVRPTGTSNDTSYLQNAINAYSVLVLKAGTYLVDAVTKWTIPSNRLISFEPGAILQVITNNSDSYRVMDLYGSENVNIYNPKIIGDRTTHTGVTGEQGHGIVISTGSNINIYNPTISNCWGDGITIYGGINVYIENVNIDNCRRQGISITNADGVTIEGGIISNINGTAPECGIDLEPNSSAEQLKNININNLVTKNCNAYGIMIVPQNIVTTAHEISIFIRNHKDYGSKIGFVLSGMRPTVQMSGVITVEDSYYKDNKEEGIRLLDYQYLYSPLMRIVRPTVINPNVNASVTPRYGACQDYKWNRPLNDRLTTIVISIVTVI